MVLFTWRSPRFQYLIIIALALVLMGFVAILCDIRRISFQLYIGQRNPLWAFLVIAALGIYSLSQLHSKNWFSIYKKGALRQLIPYFLAIASLGLAIILIDLKVVFPEDFNIPWPDSLMFYPVMGFIAEVVFHVVPLHLVLLVITTFSKRDNFNKIIWPCLFFVALLEPIFQAFHGFSGDNPLWSDVYVSFHILFINVIQMLIFKRFDFVSMYLIRLWYYLIWHIGWGHLRLDLLF